MPTPNNPAQQTHRKYYLDRDYEQADLFRLLKNHFSIDYRELITDYRSKFDLLISQYAGFLSGVRKPCLKPGGDLLVNHSHGDAGLVSLARDYDLVAAVRRQGKCRLSTASLADYFIPRQDIQVTRERLLERGKGVGCTETAPLYFFKKVG